MRTTPFLAAVALLASSALAQLPNGIPSCAAGCIGSSFGGCSAFDYQCICNNKAYLAQLACCVHNNCDATDQENTIKLANQLCAAQSAGTTNLPTAATCASGASSTGTGTTSGGGTAAATQSTGSTGTASSTSTSASEFPAQTTGTSLTMSSSTESATAATSTGAAHHAGLDVGLGLAAVGALFAL